MDGKWQSPIMKERSGKAEGGRIRPQVLLPLADWCIVQTHRGSPSQRPRSPCSPHFTFLIRDCRFAGRRNRRKGDCRSTVTEGLWLRVTIARLFLHKKIRFARGAFLLSRSPEARFITCVLLRDLFLAPCHRKFANLLRYESKCSNFRAS